MTSAAAFSDDELAKVADGRVFDGRQGLPLKLVDAFGGEREAVAWLEAEKGVPRICRSGTESACDFRSACISPASRRKSPILRGLSGFAAALRELSDAGAPMDGLLSVWQLSAGN